MSLSKVVYACASHQQARHRFEVGSSMHTHHTNLLRKCGKVLVYKVNNLSQQLRESVTDGITYSVDKIRALGL